MFMDVAMWEHCTFDSEVFRCGKVVTPLSILILCKLSFPIVGLKCFGIEIPNSFHMVFRECIKHVPVPNRSCPSHHLFYLLFRHEHSEQ
jgi:hypothetical protein